ncbi:MAG: hypothetical protein WD000_09340 [Thermodesulfobacteriota bacterium]
MIRILVATMSILLISFILTWPSPSGAEKVHTVKLTKGQVIVKKERPNEFTAYMLSESGSGGILVTPSENPSFGNILSVYAKEKKELPDIGYPGGTKSGIELRVIFEDDISNLPEDAWITFNIYQSGAIGICSYNKSSVICGPEKQSMNNQ